MGTEFGRHDAGHADKAGLSAKGTQPATQGRELIKRNTAFGGKSNVGKAGDIGDGWCRGRCQPSLAQAVAFCKMIVDCPEH